MFVKRYVIVLAVLTIMLLPAAVCYAQNNIFLSQACAWEQNIDVFIAGDMNAGNLSCKVSNQPATVADGGLLADKGVTVRTTILIDISTSIPSQMRGKIVSYIDLLIKNISKNEQYKLVAFGEQLSVLQNFTSDRYDLSNAAKKIEFNGKESKIYDAIYNTIPRIQPIDGTPCYYRTIVITDGVDDTVSGITKEELYLKLQADRYPIDVVSVSKTRQDEPTKELSALIRMSGGRYFNLNNETDLQQLWSSIAVSGVFWLRATIPDALLDGSTRQFDISDGINFVQFDFKVPIFEVPAIETPSPGILPAEEPATVISSAPNEKKTQPPPPRGNSKSDDSEIPGSALPLSNILGEYTAVAYIGAGVALIILVSVIIAVIAVKGKKKKSTRKKGTSKVNGTVAALSQKTEIISCHSRNTEEKTAPTGRLCVRLRNINNPVQIWEISLAGGVLIGRDTKCQVCINEKSMSRQQCRLYVDVNGVPTAENLSSANITQLNGELLTTPGKISEGDKLKCGRVTLVIDSLYRSSSGNVGNINKMTEFVNV